MDKQKMCCENCKWFIRNKSDWDDKRKGKCKRFPPKIGSFYGIEFPGVTKDEFCGEFNPQE